MTIGTLFTLFVVPVFYSLIAAAARAARGRAEDASARRAARRSLRRPLELSHEAQRSAGHAGRAGRSPALALLLAAALHGRRARLRGARGRACPPPGARPASTGLVPRDRPSSPAGGAPRRPACSTSSSSAPRAGPRPARGARARARGARAARRRRRRALPDARRARPPTSAAARARTRRSAASSPDSDIYTAGFDAAWEVDLWGRVRRSVEAADADLAASVEDARDVAVTRRGRDRAATTSSCAPSSSRVAIARTNVALQEQTLALVRGALRGRPGRRARRGAGARPTSRRRARACRRSRSGCAPPRTAWPCCSGCRPARSPPSSRPSRPIPVPPAEVAVGVPADLLRRRADVRRAERELAAETARIGVAEGELYPRLTLFGSLGLAADDAADLFESDSDVFGIGPSLRWNLFDGGRLREPRRGAGRAHRAGARALGAHGAARARGDRERDDRVRARAGAPRARSARPPRRRAARSSSRARSTPRASPTSRPCSTPSARSPSSRTSSRRATPPSTTHLVALYKALGGGWDPALKIAAR